MSAKKKAEVKELVYVRLDPKKIRQVVAVQDCVLGAAKLLEFCYEENMTERSDYEEVCNGVSTVLFAAVRRLDDIGKHEYVPMEPMPTLGAVSTRRKKPAA